MISDGDQDWARARPRACAAAGDANPRDLDVQMPREACLGAGTGAADAGGIVPGRVLVHADAAGVFPGAASSGSSGNVGWPLVVAPSSKKSVSPGVGVAVDRSAASERLRTRARSYLAPARAPPTRERLLAAVGSLAATLR
jgi:hypothetical protein